MHFRSRLSIPRPIKFPYEFSRAQQKRVTSTGEIIRRVPTPFEKIAHEKSQTYDKIPCSDVINV